MTTAARLTVRAAAPEHYPWLTERTRCARTEGFRAIEAVDSAGRIVGMVGYDLWTEYAVHAHMAVEHAIAWRSLLVPAFRYPFEQCGRGLLIAAIPAHNSRSRHLAERFGFRESYRVLDGWALGDDMILLEMRRNDCRYLEAHHG